MLSSTDIEKTNQYNKSNSLKTPLSSTSSTSTYSSPNSPHSPFQIRPKSMEEVWKDINLSSLHDHQHHHHHHHHNNHQSSSREEGIDSRLQNPQNLKNPNFILQDFLARPSNKDPPTSLVNSNGDTTLFGSPLPFHPHPTILSLNSGLDFGFLDSSEPLVRPNSRLNTNHHITNVSSFNNPVEGLGQSSDFCSFGKKRVHESGTNTSSDRRHKRMIKNRESAARSRARKQAYTSELQLEVAQLMEENARLKRQQEQHQMCLAVAASQVSRKHSLYRTSTAPF